MRNVILTLPCILESASRHSGSLRRAATLIVVALDSREIYLENVQVDLRWDLQFRRQLLTYYMCALWYGTVFIWIDG
jgi:hypothetical protein